MKIRERLTLIYALSSASVLLALGLFIYFFSQRFHEHEFYQRLDDRVKITEQLFLEVDKLDSDVLRDIREKFLHKLDNEIEIVKKVENLDTDPETKNLPVEFIQDLKRTGRAQFNENGIQGLGKIFNVENEDYAIIVTAEDIFGKSKLRNLLQILTVGFIASLLIVYFIGIFSAEKAFQPVADKIKQVKTISANNLHQRLHVLDESDEIGELATTFNDLLERLELSFEMQKKFISNASHEIRNPLAAIMGEAEVCLSKERSSEAYRHSLTVIQNQAGRLNSLVNNLLHLAKTGFDEKLIRKDSVKMDDLLFEIIENLQFSAPESKVSVQINNEDEGAEIFEIRGNSNLLKSAISNLIENGCKFSQNKPVSVNLSANDKIVIVEVVDQGIGIPENEIKNIFEPFYRAENARVFSGFGIGLPLTQRILQLHGGRLQFRTKEGEGSVFSIEFTK